MGRHRKASKLALFVSLKSSWSPWTRPNALRVHIQIPAGQRAKVTKLSKGRDDTFLVTIR